MTKDISSILLLYACLIVKEISYDIPLVSETANLLACLSIVRV